MHKKFGEGPENSPEANRAYHRRWSEIASDLDRYFPESAYLRASKKRSKGDGIPTEQIPDGFDSAGVGDLVYLGNPDAPDGSKPTIHFHSFEGDLDQAIQRDPDLIDRMASPYQRHRPDPDYLEDMGDYPSTEDWEDNE